MKKKKDYYQIVTSLPLLQGKINSDFSHMSRLNFNKHIKDLSREDFKMVQDLENFVIWEKHSMDSETDKAFKDKSLDLLQKYDNQTFAKIITATIDKRFLLGLIRKRINGQKEPPKNEDLWRLSKYKFKIQNNWNKTDFGIKHLSKELAGFDYLMQEHSALELEKQILKLMWKFCDKISQDHYFDIDFILIYAIRRNIIERWKIASDSQDIRDKFNKLAMEAIHGK
ncbi:MAG: DUF2764 domain-containing protein [Alphaproteobacteria bacterium]|jgi:hypothetical protein|nr:DUF2764 domain-containing protein [Alphaproteobacteria bacterium]